MKKEVACENEELIPGFIFNKPKKDSEEFIYRDPLKMRDVDFNLIEDLIERASIPGQEALKKFLDEVEDFRKLPIHPYLVSSCGRVFSLIGEGREFPIVKKCDWYQIINVNFLGKFIGIGVHRLVMYAFYGFHGGYCVNHINGLKGDNRLLNLEFVTTKQNSKHAKNMGLTKCRNYFDNVENNKKSSSGESASYSFPHDK